MSNLGQKAPGDNTDLANEMSAETDLYDDVVKVTDQKSPRVYIREGIVKRLVERGVPDDKTSVTVAVNDITEFALNMLITELVTFNDLAVLERELTDRLEELTIANLETAKLLSEIGITAELKGSLKTFRQIVEESRPKEAV